MKSIYLKAAFYLTLAGSLFAGYMSGVKIFSHTCPFNETCPYFLSYPACWFGLAMFFTMFIISILGLLKKITCCHVKKTLSFISLLGILFAGRYVVDEIMLYLNQGVSHYTLILPTCTYGLIFYIIIFTISMKRCENGTC